jgi:hypothetical protein
MHRTAPSLLAWRPLRPYLLFYFFYRRFIAARWTHLFALLKVCTVDKKNEIVNARHKGEEKYSSPLCRALTVSFFLSLHFDGQPEEFVVYKFVIFLLEYLQYTNDYFSPLHPAFMCKVNADAEFTCWLTGGGIFWRLFAHTRTNAARGRRPTPASY